MSYAQCTKTVKKGSTIDVRLKFGEDVARYALSLWEVTANGYMPMGNPVEKLGASRDPRNKEFEIPVDWQGKRLIYFPAVVRYPGDAGKVSTIIDVFADGQSIGSSEIREDIKSGESVTIRNGLVLEAST